MYVRFTPIDADHLEALQRRVESIPVNRVPRWGSMDAPHMFAHLRRSLELVLGEYPEPDRSTWVKRMLARVMFSPMPWPKNTQSPAYFHPDPQEGEQERRRLIEVLGEFTEEVTNNPDRVAVSPVFGPASLKVWAKWQGRHFEHHLRQFGV